MVPSPILFLGLQSRILFFPFPKGLLAFVIHHLLLKPFKKVICYLSLLCQQKAGPVSKEFQILDNSPLQYAYCMYS